MRKIPFSAAAVALAAATLLAGCASLAPDGGVGDIDKLVASRTGTDGTAKLTREPTEVSRARVAQLLSQPLEANDAVEVALLNSPRLQASLAALGVADAEGVQAGRLANPSVSLGRFNEGSKREIERMLSFDVLSIVTLPWRQQWAGQQAELSRMQAAQQVVRLAADTRAAWIRAVAAQQTADYLADAREAADAGAQLGERMVNAGNWSRLRQSREQAVFADVIARQSRAKQAAISTREQLARLMGLPRTPVPHHGHAPQAFTLAARLPGVPDALPSMHDVQQRALDERLDVRAAQAESRFVADSLGYQRVTAVVNALEVDVTRNTTFDNTTGARETKRGATLTLPLPVFDWGQASGARSQALYLQSVARVRDIASQAASEARENWALRDSAWALATHYRQSVIPLRQRMQGDTLLRYNGMLASPWDVLDQIRDTVDAVTATINAERDFWLADTQLQLVLTGTSPSLNFWQMEP